MKLQFCVAITATWAIAMHSEALAVDPAPLESAYWRFEEGTAGSAIVPGANNVLNSLSVTNNHLRTANTGTAPTYTSETVPFPLRSGAANNVAIDLTANPGGAGGDDLFTESGNEVMTIRNGMIGGPNGAGVSGFTLEAAFKADAVPFDTNRFQAIIAKEGQPNGGLLPTLALKVRGDNSNLQIELIDGSGTARQVQSLNPIAGDKWYAAAAVNDGSTLSLYLNEGSGYQLQGTTPVSGALYQGPNNDDWEHNWAIGRAQFGGGNTDWFNGILDEVRLSNSALAPSEFLFNIPEPSTFVLATGLAMVLWRARRRSY